MISLFEGLGMCLRNGDFSWKVNSLFFSKGAHYSGHFLRVNSRGHFWNAGGMGSKPLLDSANTVQCQVKGCGGKAYSRIREHCLG